MKTHEEILQQQREYYKNNKGRIIDKAKEYHKKNRSIIILRNKKYYKDNKNRLNAMCKEYYKRKRDVFKINNQSYHQKNRDKINLRHRKYYMENKDKIKKYQKEYNRENHNIVKMKKKIARLKNRERDLKIKQIYQRTERGKEVATKARTKRQLKSRGFVFNDGITEETQKRAIRETEGKCVYCGVVTVVYTDRKAPPDRRTFEHIIPKSKCVPDIHKFNPNGIENITVSCNVCNIRKKDKTVEEYFKEIDKDIPELIKDKLSLMKRQKVLVDNKQEE